MTTFNTEEPHLCLQFTEKFINGIQHQLEQCNSALRTQCSSYPDSLTIDLLDQRLKEYVHSQQKPFRHKINSQLLKYKQMVQEKQLYHTLFNVNLARSQVSSTVESFSFE